MGLKRDNLRCGSVGKRRSLQEFAPHGGVCGSRGNTGTDVYISQEKILSLCLTNIPTHLPRREHPGCCPPSEVQGLVSEYGMGAGAWSQQRCERQCLGRNLEVSVRRSEGSLHLNDGRSISTGRGLFHYASPPKTRNKKQPPKQPPAKSVPSKGA